MTQQELIRQLGALSVLRDRKTNRRDRKRIDGLIADTHLLIDVARLIEDEDALISAGKRPPLPPVLLMPVAEVRGG